MFRASRAHLQEDTVVHMQHMVLSLCKQVSGRVLLKHDFLDITIQKSKDIYVLTQAVYRQATRNSHRQ